MKKITVPLLAVFTVFLLFAPTRAAHLLPFTVTPSETTVTIQTVAPTNTHDVTFQLTGTPGDRITFAAPPILQSGDPGGRTQGLTLIRTAGGQSVDFVTLDQAGAATVTLTIEARDAHPLASQGAIPGTYMITQQFVSALSGQQATGTLTLKITNGKKITALFVQGEAGKPNPMPLYTGSTLEATQGDTFSILYVSTAFKFDEAVPSLSLELTTNFPPSITLQEVVVPWTNIRPDNDIPLNILRKLFTVSIAEDAPQGTYRIEARDGNDIVHMLNLEVGVGGIFITDFSPLRFDGDSGLAKCTAKIDPFVVFGDADAANPPKPTFRITYTDEVTEKEGKKVFDSNPKEGKPFPGSNTRYGIAADVGKNKVFKGSVVTVTCTASLTTSKGTFIAKERRTAIRSAKVNLREGTGSDGKKDGSLLCTFPRDKGVLDLFGVTEASARAFFKIDDETQPSTNIIGRSVSETSQPPGGGPPTFTYRLRKGLLFSDIPSDLQDGDKVGCRADLQILPPARVKQGESPVLEFWGSDITVYRADCSVIGKLVPLEEKIRTIRFIGVGDKALYDRQRQSILDILAKDPIYKNYLNHFFFTMVTLPVPETATSMEDLEKQAAPLLPLCPADHTIIIGDPQDTKNEKNIGLVTGVARTFKTPMKLLVPDSLLENVFRHEFAHLFGGLDDERSGVEEPDSQKTNCAATQNCILWQSFLNDGLASCTQGCGDSSHYRSADCSIMRQECQANGKLFSQFSVVQCAYMTEFLEKIGDPAFFPDSHIPLSAIDLEAGKARCAPKITAWNLVKQ